jgi:hypothetical protein
MRERNANYGEGRKCDRPLKIESRKRNGESGSAGIKTVDIRVLTMYKMKKK